MRTFFRLAVIFAAFSIVLFSSGCGTDTPGLPGGVTLPPVISLNSGVDLVSFNVDQPLNSPTITVSVSGQDGDAALRDLRIRENGVNVPAAQLNFRTGQTSNNPILLLGADADGFTYEIEITPSSTTAGDVTFSFLLTDVDGETAATEVIVTYTVSPPTTELIIADGFVSGDATITSTTPSFVVQLLATRTEDDISTITVLENGAIIDASQLTFADGAITAANPLSVAGDGGVVDIIVRPASVINNDVRSYTFRVTDVNGASSEQTVNITFIVPARDLEFEMMGVFFNASGSRLGGLDLDNGTAVGFNSTAAEIEDEGVNLDEANAEKWRAQISATNDAVLRIANLSVLGDGITFDDVELQADISRAFDEGNGTLGGNDNVPDTDGDLSRTEIVTTQLQGGEVFAVRRGARTYLVRIDEVNYVANSNADNYSVSIKY